MAHINRSTPFSIYRSAGYALPGSIETYVKYGPSLPNFRADTAHHSGLWDDTATIFIEPGHVGFITTGGLATDPATFVSVASFDTCPP